MGRMHGEATLLRIYLGENDRHGGRPLHQEIVRLARELGLAGATVVRGVLGYGARSVIHSAHILRLSEDLPLVIEIVDERERLEPFLAQAGAMIDTAGCGSLMTLEKVEVIRYRAGETQPDLDPTTR
ncbi:MAG: DUF190 domain-containing protein [Thermoanaerobaculia bacterium]|nr:DUF190 domain-containing protein [Thermoanaerobaculia bacterium]